jgi:hypothetical protein
MRWWRRRGCRFVIFNVDVDGFDVDSKPDVHVDVGSDDRGRTARDLAGRLSGDGA